MDPLHSISMPQIDLNLIECSIPSLTSSLTASASTIQCIPGQTHCKGYIFIGAYVNIIQFNNVTIIGIKFVVFLFLFLFNSLIYYMVYEHSLR